MTDNLDLWNRLGQTDPKHTKEFTRGGGFKGTAIKPMFSYRRLTEEFGPCGTGWGVDAPSFQVVAGDNKEVLVFCTVSGWYQLNGERRTVFGVGGDKVVSHIKANDRFNRAERWENDDEAFKKAFTDALTNAFKLVGVGADVHMGMFDDNKYVSSMRQHFSEENDDKRPADKEPPFLPQAASDRIHASIDKTTTVKELNELYRREEENIGKIRAANSATADVLMAAFKMRKELINSQTKDAA